MRRQLVQASRWTASLSRPSICARCAHRLDRAASRSTRTLTSTNWKPGFFVNHFAKADGRHAAYTAAAGTSDAVAEDNVVLSGSRGKKDGQEGAPMSTTITTKEISSPRVRRRDRLKQSAATVSDANGNLAPLPLDASSTLSALASSSPPMSLKRKLLAYLALTKPRLATLIVLTTTASYSLYPVPSLLSVSATHAPSLSTLTLLFLTTGTFSTIASANALNMLFETRHDAAMSRTRNRPLVRGLITPRAAALFALATALLGTTVLWVGVNPTTAVLGASNIALYAFVYTPMKRLSIANTWAGAVVGAIPPLMGWTAAGGHYLSATTTPGVDVSALQGFVDEARALLFTPEAAGGWLLAGLLFAWQFPHFNALSHPIRHEYFAAGYKMTVSLAPRLNARVALRYSLAMFPLCVGLSYYGVTDKGFVVSSGVANAWMVREAWRFWRSGGGESAAAQKAARGLFWASVWHLPLVLVLAMVHKRGLWDGIWRSLMGEEEEDDDLLDEFED